jgi:serine/threonine protein kinase
MIIDGKYELLEKLNEGSFGQVFKAKHVRTGELVAVKIERKNSEAGSSLKNEARIYQYLAKEQGFPTLKWFKSDEQFSYIVTNLLVYSLTNLVKIKGQIPLKNILQLGIQMIKRIETLHNKYLLHRDIKPDNFMLGPNKQLYLIDFGLCKRYDHDGKHIEETRRPNKPIIGSVNFVSLNVHKSIEPGRRDDIESCIYIILYLLQGGQLYWFKESNIKKIAILKEQLTTTNTLACHPFIEKMLANIRNLAFQEEPNYGELINILEKELKETANV